MFKQLGIPVNQCIRLTSQLVADAVLLFIILVAQQYSLFNNWGKYSSFAIAWKRFCSVWLQCGCNIMIFENWIDISTSLQFLRTTVDVSVTVFISSSLMSTVFKYNVGSKVIKQNKQNKSVVSLIAKLKLSFHSKLMITVLLRKHLLFLNQLLLFHLTYKWTTFLLNYCFKQLVLLSFFVSSQNLFLKIASGISLDSTV